MSVAAPARQLALPLPYQAQYGADFLAAASNEAARVWLGRVAEWPQRRLGLWGDAGTGKTHLLHRWAEANAAELLPGSTLPGLTASPARPVAIDDADGCADEAALLHLMNHLAEAGLPLLLAGRLPPARWRVGLPDLRSRLRAILAVGIAPAEDELLRALLARLLAERQLAVPAAVQDWLLVRLPRTPAAIRDVAARLDHAALAAGSRISRGLAAEQLADLLSGQEAAGPTIRRT